MNEAAETACAGRPWLSVVMPVHCGERWLDASLRSLAAEADDGIEILFIDSSPSPASCEIATRYADRLRLRIMQREDLVKWQSKTNLGVELAEADHISWLHQDDVWLPGRTAAVRAFIEEAPEAALHLSPSAIIDSEGRRLGVWRCPFGRSGEIEPTFALERLLVQNSIAAPAPVFRRDAWLAAGGMDEALWYTGDWDIWLKLAAAGPLRYRDEVTTGFRVHGGSQTVTGSRDIQDFERQMQIVRDRHLPRVSNNARNKVRRASGTSIAVNLALAAAAAGDSKRLLSAAASILRLGPGGIYEYFRDSRLVERVAPRVRARLAGAF